MITMELKGFDEVDRMLAELPMRVQKNAVRAGLRAAANIIKSQAISNAPSEQGPKFRHGRPGILKKAIYAVSSRRKSKGGMTTFSVDVNLARSFLGGRTYKEKGGASMSQSRKWWFHPALTGGHKVVGPYQRRGMTPTGKVPRSPKGRSHVPGRPYLGPALESKASAAIEAMRARLESYIQTYNAKAAK